MNATQRTPEQNECVEQMAKDIHRHVRAANKAIMHFHSGSEHDHGWEACHKKKYFRQRAARELQGKL
jgi:nucleoid-associated protein YejK